MNSCSSSSTCAGSLKAHSSRRLLSMTARHLKAPRACLTLLLASLLVSMSFFVDLSSAKANTVYTDIISITGTGTFDPPICVWAPGGTGTFSMFVLAVGAEHALNASSPLPITGDEVAIPSGLSASGTYRGVLTGSGGSLVAAVIHPLSGGFNTLKPLKGFELSTRSFSVNANILLATFSAFWIGDWHVMFTNTPLSFGPTDGGCQQGIKDVLIEGTLTRALGN